MPRYSKRKGRQRKQTRRLRGGLLGLNFGFGKKNAAAAAVDGDPDIGDIDSHESAVSKKVQAADAALVAARESQQRLQQEQINTGKCASKVKEVIKKKSARSRAHVSDIKKEVDQLDNQLTKLNAQKKETDKAFAEANKTLSAVNASAGPEFKKCLQEPDNYNLAIPNVDPAEGVNPPHQGPNVREGEQLDDLRGEGESSHGGLFDGGKKRKSKKRKSKKHKSKKRKSKKRRKTRKGGVRCNTKLGYNCPHYQKYGKHMKGGKMFFDHP